MIVKIQINKYKDDNRFNLKEKWKVYNKNLITYHNNKEYIKSYSCLFILIFLSYLRIKKINCIKYYRKLYWIFREYLLS